MSIAGPPFFNLKLKIGDAFLNILIFLNKDV